MKKTQLINISLLRISFLIVILLTAFQNISPAYAASNAGTSNNRTIKNATILIEIRLPNAGTNAKNNDLLAHGIGTLIRTQGETLLVTHNHWSLIQDTAIVRFLDADNRLIQTIIGKDFRALIAYADAGTLILRPTQEIIKRTTPVRLDCSSQVPAGETVDIVYRKSAGGPAAIQQAVVVEISTYKGLPVYKLRSLNGKHIQPGDSGGGIWYKDQLVGNNWFVEAKSTNGNRTYTEISHGAALVINSLLQQQLQANAPAQTTNQANRADMARSGQMATP